MKNGKAAVLTAMFVGGISWVARAADMPDAKDHPLLKRFAGSEIVGYDVKNFEEYELQTSTFKVFDLQSRTRRYAAPPLHVEGAITRLWYEAAGDTSSTELARNYVDELTSRGFEILYDSGRDPAAKDWTNFMAPFQNDHRRTSRANAVMAASRQNFHSISAKLARPEGDAYVSVITLQWDSEDKIFRARRGAYASVDIIETRAMKQKMVTVTADEMSRALASSGRVALYGIFFDSDKADVLPKSKAALDEIAKLMKAQHALKLRVVGHTDGVGAMEANLALSKKRADAVAAVLAKEYGIDGRRLASHGVASLAPATSNATEEGRSKNRRVELVPW